MEEPNSGANGAESERPGPGEDAEWAGSPALREVFWADKPAGYGRGFPGISPALGLSAVDRGGVNHIKI